MNVEGRTAQDAIGGLNAESDVVPLVTIKGHCTIDAENASSGQCDFLTIDVKCGVIHRGLVCGFVGPFKSEPPRFRQGQCRGAFCVRVVVSTDDGEVSSVLGERHRRSIGGHGGPHGRVIGVSKSSELGSEHHIAVLTAEQNDTVGGESVWVSQGQREGGVLVFCGGQ